MWLQNDPGMKINMNWHFLKSFINQAWWTSLSQRYTEWCSHLDENTNQPRDSRGDKKKVIHAQSPLHLSKWPPEAKVMSPSTLKFLEWDLQLSAINQSINQSINQDEFNTLRWEQQSRETIISILKKSTSWNWHSCRRWF